MFSTIYACGCKIQNMCIAPGIDGVLEDTLLRFWTPLNWHVCLMHHETILRQYSPFLIHGLQDYFPKFEKFQRLRRPLHSQRKKDVLLTLLSQHNVKPWFLGQWQRYLGCYLFERRSPISEERRSPIPSTILDFRMFNIPCKILLMVVLESIVDKFPRPRDLPFPFRYRLSCLFLLAPITCGCDYLAGHQTKKLIESVPKSWHGQQTCHPKCTSIHNGVLWMIVLVSQEILSLPQFFAKRECYRHLVLHAFGH